MTPERYEALAEDALNVGAKLLEYGADMDKVFGTMQFILGQTDGGPADIFVMGEVDKEFADHPDYERHEDFTSDWWDNLTDDEGREMLARYVDFEKNYLDVEEKKPETFEVYVATFGMGMAGIIDGGRVEEVKKQGLDVYRVELSTDKKL